MAGAFCRLLWTGVAEVDPGGPAIDPGAARRGRPAFHRGAAVGNAAAFHWSVVAVAEPAIGDATVQPPAAFGPHPAFDAMALIEAASVHVTNL